MNYDSKIDTVDGDGDSGTFDPLDRNDEVERRSDRRMWIVGGVAIIVLVGLWFLNHMNSDEKMAPSRDSQAPVVSVISPGSGAIAGLINATGTLAARRELPVGVVGDGGAVERVLVEPGQWVKAGQVLAVIDRSVQSQQQASLAAQVQVASADARLAQANLDRALQLVDRGFISKADVDRLTATRDAAAARVRVSQAQLAEMRARTARLNITAPAAGLLLERNVEPGQVVTPGTGVLFRIAKGGEMEVLAKLSEDDLARLSTGTSAQVTPVGSDKAFPGQIWQVSPVIDPDTRQGEARIALPYNSALRPGGFASLQIKSGSIVAPMVAKSALLADSKGSYVFVVDKNNKIARRDVKTGAISENGIAILDGLSGKEKIVLRAGAFLSVGETVKPQLLKAS